MRRVKLKCQTRPRTRQHIKRRHGNRSDEKDDLMNTFKCFILVLEEVAAAHEAFEVMRRNKIRLVETSGT